MTLGTFLADTACLPLPGPSHSVPWLKVTARSPQHHTLQHAPSAKARSVHVSAQERGHSESNGPAEQVHPARCNDSWINKARRTQTQVRGPKGEITLPNGRNAFRPNNRETVRLHRDPLCPVAAGSSSQDLPLPAGGAWWKKNFRITPLTFSHLS